jgi:cell wall-associated NlpC family hydrolase
VKTVIPGAKVGSPYLAKLTATGGSGLQRWQLTSGSLPPGLSLSPGGQLTGTPQQAGTFTLTVRAVDSNGQVGSAVLTLVIAPGHATGAPAAPVTPTGPDSGLLLLSGDGGIYTYGDAAFKGAADATTTANHEIGLAATPDGQGYWVLSASGQVTAFGDAQSYGDASHLQLSTKIVSIAPTPDGLGYWLATADGSVFAFGDANYFGSGPDQALTGNVVGVVGTPDGQGYWLITSTGGVYGFGDAGVFGAGAAVHLTAPVVGLTPTADGNGYWLVTANGGVFAFGDASFFGSGDRVGATASVVGLTATSDGQGYWLLTASGEVYAFGDASNLSPAGAIRLQAPAAALALPIRTALGAVPLATVEADHLAVSSCPALPWSVLAALGSLQPSASGAGATGATAAALSSATQAAQFGAAVQLAEKAADAEAARLCADGLSASAPGGTPTTSNSAGSPTPTSSAATDATAGSPASAAAATVFTYVPPFAASEPAASGSGTEPTPLDAALVKATGSSTLANEVLSLAAIYAGQPGTTSAAVALAQAELGVPYLWGGTTPTGGFDCSGLVQWIYRQLGVSLPRTSQEQWATLSHVPTGVPLAAGDLVFFGPSDGPTHVGLYIGDGLMIDAPHTGSVVRIDPYQWPDYIGAALP